MTFEVSKREHRWFVSDGALRFGPYRSEAKARDSAAALNDLRAVAALTPAELVEREAPRPPPRPRWGAALAGSPA